MVSEELPKRSSIDSEDLRNNQSFDLSTHPPHAIINT